ncbi:hypothetical protein P7H17_25490 [Paenibacillus larvae]|nr:hypothetical protein [Paenibacillus larvae]MDT2288731.1 hypothetical protein [Paenibacillus larvae]
MPDLIAEIEKGTQGMTDQQNQRRFPRYLAQKLTNTGLSCLVEALTNFKP